MKPALYVAFVWAPGVCPPPSSPDPRDHGHRVCLGAFEDMEMAKLRVQENVAKVGTHPRWWVSTDDPVAYYAEGESEPFTYRGYVERVDLDRRSMRVGSAHDRRRS